MAFTQLKSCQKVYLCPFKPQYNMNTNEIINKAKQWIKAPFDTETQNEIQEL